jgi:uncharacterized membrane protein
MAEPEKETTTSLQVQDVQEPAPSGTERSLVNYTHLTYGFMAVGVLAYFSSHSFTGLSLLTIQFYFCNLSLPFIIGAIMAHIRRADAKPYWLANHYRWMIRTFWFCLLFQIFYIHFFGLSTATMAALWACYRIVKGWVHLYSSRPIPRYRSQ